MNLTFHTQLQFIIISVRLAGQDQPHLHLMYCERSVDEHNRTAEQFFSRYNDKDPANGGAQKITPDIRGKGKTIINEMRVDTEIIINEHLEKYSLTKIINIKGIDVEVPNSVSCLHHEDYKPSARYEISQCQ